MCRWNTGIKLDAMTKKKSILWPLNKGDVEKNSLGVTMKDVVAARKNQEAVAEINRGLTLLLAKWFFAKFGRDLKDYEARIPLQVMPEDSDRYYFPDRLKYEKQCSESVYILTKEGIMPIRWCYAEYMNSWERSLGKFNPDPDEKFITEKLHREFENLLDKILLGILGADSAVRIIDQDKWEILDIMFEEEYNYFKDDKRGSKG